MNCDRTTVFYDGSCPLCEKEVAYYRKCSGAETIDWVDVSDGTELEAAPGLARAEALRRFHVRTKQGLVVAGGDAFIELWSVVPRFKLFATALRWPPLRWVVNKLYDGFLVVRPHIQYLLR